MKKISEKQNKKLEIICIVALIIIALISLAYTKLKQNVNNKKNQLAIHINDTKINKVGDKTIDINNDLTFIIFKDQDNIIKTDIIEYSDEVMKKYNGYEYNVIMIKDNNISCINASCPDKICVNHGALHKDIDNDMIVCAPHKMTIAFE